MKSKVYYEIFNRLTGVVVEAYLSQLRATKKLEEYNKQFRHYHARVMKGSK